MSHSSLNASKNGFTVCERRKLSKKILCRQKSNVIAHKITSPKVSNCNRLVGGADIIEEAKGNIAEALQKSIQEVPRSPPPSTSQSLSGEETTQLKDKDKNNPQDEQLLPTGGPCCSCLSQTPGLVGDRKIDELIKYVHQNLKEAGNALATLDENFEHDLKLMFVDILGRIKLWTGNVQNKLNDCKSEVNNLRKEFLARLCEIETKTREMEDLKAQLANCQSSLMNIRENAAISNPRKPVGIPRNSLGNSSNPLGNSSNPLETAKETVIKNGARAIANGKDEIGEEDEEDEEEDEEGFPEKRDDKKKRKHLAIQTNMQEKDRIKRESELESEVKQLRKEYERMVKERAEYENAIQRALLRGVSSLNVEALRVLRYPPIPCCTPCSPCPATAGIIPPEPVIPCCSKSTKRQPESMTIIDSAKVPHAKNIRNGDQVNCTTKRPCASPCCSGKSRKPTNGNMVFLLRQGDSGNLIIPDKDERSVCKSPIMKKIHIPPLPKLGT